MCVCVCLSASALCKTVHTLCKSYHVGRCVCGTLASFSLLYIFPLSPYPFSVITHHSIKFIYCCMIEVRGMSYVLCVCLVLLPADA